MLTQEINNDDAGSLTMVVPAGRGPAAPGPTYGTHATSRDPDSLGRMRPAST